MVLMSWCMVTTLTPVTPSTIASKTERVVSIRWVRTCFSKSRPFSAESDLTKKLSQKLITMLAAIPQQRTGQLDEAQVVT